MDNTPHYAEIQSYENFVNNEYKNSLKNLIKRNINDRFQTYKNMEKVKLLLERCQPY